MNFIQIPYFLLIKPLEILFEYIFAVAFKGSSNPIISVTLLSLTVNLLVLPLYNRADEVQDKEHLIEQKLQKGVSHIRKTFKGDEKMMMLQTYYRQNHYKPTDAFKGSVSLLLEIPFFIAAYRFLSGLSAIRGVSFGAIADLGSPDALIQLGAFSINLLPFLMTAVNLISSAIFTKGYPLKTKIQLYGMALFFLVLLYKSPSGLVLYWPFNNVFSLGKTLYYKFPRVKKTFNYLFFGIGVALLFSIPLIRIKLTGSKSFLLIVVLFSFILFAPLLSSILKKKDKKIRIALLEKDFNYRKFLAGGLYLTFFIGTMIPAGVIVSSSAEFVDLYNFKSPLWFILSSFCIASGLFVIWPGIFYALSTKKIRVLFEMCVWVLAGIATTDFIFFGKSRSTLNSSLAYTNPLTFPMKTMLINILVVGIVLAAFIVLFSVLKDKIVWIMAIGSSAIVVMSVINITGIIKNTSDLRIQAENTGKEMPTCTLSRNGKNVIVIMLDKAPGMYMPYFINEKPELKDMYAGFTYYPNTISYGAYTNIGSPEIFGGYEYTPEEMNKRDDILLKDKHNEALKMMPVIFSENEFEVTVCDAPYADYKWISDMSIFDEYPDINTYYTKGYFWAAHEEGVSERDNRNFFCYAFMKCMPLVTQNHFYDNGFYNENLQANDFSDEIDSGSWQYVRSNTVAQGIYNNFMWDFATLQNLEKMTVITDDNINRYFSLENDSTHDPIMFQEPEYEIKYDVDNTKYEEENSDRYTVNQITLEMTTDDHYRFYQTNMASILAIGRWLDYLKKEGVYDNTRIIITADHGKALHLNEAYNLDDGTDEFMDIEAYYPILLIKDFDSKEFTINDEFMTNADVPTYAMKDLIDNPVNPFTGNPVNNDIKYNGPQKVLGSEKWVVDENNGTQFMPGLWLSVETDMRDKNNWNVISDDRWMNY